jgi:hypothetical protein
LALSTANFAVLEAPMLTVITRLIPWSQYRLTRRALDGRGDSNRLGD